MAQIHIQPAESDALLEAVRGLLLTYGRLRQFDAALGDYEAELQNLPGEYAAPKGCLLLASVDEEPAGLVAMRPLDDSTSEMKRLFILDHYRGKGIGKLLVNDIVAASTAAGYQRMLLDTHPWMEAARKLYLSVGFREVAAYNNNPTPGIRFFELSL